MITGLILSVLSPPSHKTPPTKGHPSYQARFQMHLDSTILLNCPHEEGQPLLQGYFYHGRRGGLIKGDL